MGKADPDLKAAKTRRPLPFFGSLPMISCLAPQPLLDACEALRIKDDDAHFPIILMLPADWADQAEGVIEKAGWPRAMIHLVWLPMRFTRLERGAAWWAASRAMGGTLVAGL